MCTVRHLFILCYAVHARRQEPPTRNEIADVDNVNWTAETGVGAQEEPEPPTDTLKELSTEDRSEPPAGSKKNKVKKEGLQKLGSFFKKVGQATSEFSKGVIQGQDTDEDIEVPAFVYGEFGSEVCPSNTSTELNTEAMCIEAATELGLPYNGRTSQAKKARLPYCWMGGGGKANFNEFADKGGKADDRSRIICKEGKNDKRKKSARDHGRGVRQGINDIGGGINRAFSNFGKFLKKDRMDGNDIKDVTPSQYADDALDNPTPAPTAEPTSAPTAEPAEKASRRRRRDGSSSSSEASSESSSESSSGAKTSEKTKTAARRRRDGSSSSSTASSESSSESPSGAKTSETKTSERKTSERRPSDRKGSTRRKKRTVAKKGTRTLTEKELAILDKVY